jgi:hypothetical protein
MSTCKYERNFLMELEMVTKTLSTLFDATGSSSMPSHALLLRLFLSPSFFSVHVALRYLLLYADNIGITYYLTGRLRQLDIHELRDVWGFVW